MKIANIIADGFFYFKHLICAEIETVLFLVFSWSHFLQNETFHFLRKVGCTPMNEATLKKEQT